MTPVPTVSIIVPVYNAGRHVSATIESILHQDYQDFELLLIDDCSTDDSAARIRPYLSERVLYHRESRNHGGPSRPRNIGLHHARGRFLVMFDADDLMLPGKLRETVDQLSRNPDVGLLCTGFQSIDEDGRLLSGDYLADYRQFRKFLKPGNGSSRLSSSDAYRELLGANFVGTSSVAIPMEIIRGVGHFDEELTNGDDYDMWLRIASHYDILFIESILHSYRISVRSISSRGARNVLNRIEVLKRQIGISADPECRRRIRAKLRVNYRQLGNAERRGGNIAAARMYLKESLSYGVSLAAVKGLLVTLLPESVLRGRANDSA